MKITMPQNVKKIIALLHDSGFPAYAVGGCVRDSIIGRVPGDWDIATTANPEQSIKALENEFLIKTYGIKYGTVTVIKDNTAYEVTSFRMESDYTDLRRPSKVSFINELSDDLKRRDFTINALAYNDEEGLIDLFGGIDDINNKLIRTVGCAEKRFNEDALRIMRAVRFSSVLDFKIEPNTYACLVKNAELLKTVSSERLARELTKTLCGVNVINALSENEEVFCAIIPELKIMDGFSQHNPYHNLDIWDHTIKSVGSCKNDPILRLTMLLHDISKPDTFTLDEKGVGHFKGHPLVGEKKAARILKRLRFDNKTIKTVTTLIRHHDEAMFRNEALITKPNIKQFLRQTSPELFEMVLEIKKADSLAKAQYGLKTSLDNVKKAQILYNQIIQNNECYTLSTLEINGKDLERIGINQQQIGETLDLCLTKVINEEIINEKNSLIEFILSHVI